MKWYYKFIIFLFAFCGYLLRPTEVKAYTLGSRPLMIRVQGNADYQFTHDNGGWYTANIPTSSTFRQFNLFMGGFNNTDLLNKNIKLSYIIGLRSATGSVGMSNTALMVQTVSDVNSVCTTNSISEEDLHGIDTSTTSLPTSGYSLYQVNCHFTNFNVCEGDYCMYLQGVYVSNVPLSIYVLDSLGYEIEEEQDFSYITENNNSNTDRIISSQTQTKDAINSNTQAVNDVNNSINNDNVSGAEDSADDLVNDSAFQDSTGLSSIISMPLTFINNLSNSCNPITLTIPYMNYTFTLPCLQSVVGQYMPALVVILKVIVNGLIIYWVMLDIFKIVKNAKNPDDDRIEVLDL